LSTPPSATPGYCFAQEDGADCAASAMVRAPAIQIPPSIAENGNARVGGGSGWTAKLTKKKPPKKGALAFCPRTRCCPLTLCASGWGAGCIVRKRKGCHVLPGCSAKGQRSRSDGCAQYPIPTGSQRITILSTKPHFFSWFLSRQDSPDRPRGVGQTATPHLSPFSRGGRWCIPAGGSDLPGLHQECAIPYK